LTGGFLFVIAATSGTATRAGVVGEATGSVSTGTASTAFESAGFGRATAGVGCEVTALAG
jgi:hypothetical protein